MLAPIRHTMQLTFVFILLLFVGSQNIGCSGNSDNPSNDSSTSAAPRHDPTGDDGGLGDDNPPANDSSGFKGTWDLNRGDVISGCLGRDCIPSIQNPDFVSVAQVHYLDVDDTLFFKR